MRWCCWQLFDHRGSGAGWLQALARLVGLERLPPLVAREAAQLEQLDDPGGLASLQLGKHFPLSHFVLEWRSVGSGGEGGFVEEARFVKVLGDGRARQPSLRSYFGGPGTRVKRGASPLSPPRDHASHSAAELGPPRAGVSASEAASAYATRPARRRSKCAWSRTRRVRLVRGEGRGVSD